MKIISFDMDDTLLHDDLSISDYTLHVLKKLYQRGYFIVPASGRAQKSILPFVEKIGCVQYYISCNGAEVWDGTSHSLVSRETFSTELGKKIAAFGKKHGCYSQTYDGEYFYYSEQSHWADMYAAASMLRGQFVGDLENYINEPRAKILMMADAEKITVMLHEARELFKDQVSVTCSKPYFLEFNPLKATKGNALKIVADLCSVGMDDVCAFGDSLNDLSMLQTAGYGVAVKNARDDVKTQCKYHCLSNNEDGVAHFLDEMFLCGE